MILFNAHAYKLHHARAKGIPHDHRFLFAHIEQELQSRLQGAGVVAGPFLNLSPYPLSHPSFESPYPTETLPFPDASFDLIMSCLQIHWVGDLPCLLTHIKRCLRPGGLFLGALWGGRTLYELRESFLAAELSLTGGASPRIAPMLQPADAPFLLGKAGFSNPVADTEVLTVTYDSVKHLMRDLRGMGETNKLQDRKKTFSSRGLFEKMNLFYQTTFEASNGKIPATFEVIYLTGWGAAL